MTSARYVYGMMQACDATPVRPPGIGGGQVYQVPVSGVSAVVSAVDELDVEPTRKNLQAHLMVQNEFMKEGSFLPAAFGMVAENDEAVKQVLEDNHDLFATELIRLKGKVEASLQVLWNKEAIVAELERNDPEFVRLRAEVQHGPPGKSAVPLMQLGKKVQEMSLRWQRRFGSEIHNSLKTLASDAVILDSAVPQCILNASYLVEKAGEESFAAAISALDVQHAGKFDFRYTPHLPPYSFVEIRI